MNDLRFTVQYIGQFTFGALVLCELKISDALHAVQQGWTASGYGYSAAALSGTPGAPSREPVDRFHSTFSRRNRPSKSKYWRLLAILNVLFQKRFETLLETVHGLSKYSARRSPLETGSKPILGPVHPESRQFYGSSSRKDDSNEEKLEWNRFTGSRDTSF